MPYTINSEYKLVFTCPELIFESEEKLLTRIKLLTVFS